MTQSSVADPDLIVRYRKRPFFGPLRIWTKWSGSDPVITVYIIEIIKIKNYKTGTFFLFLADYENKNLENGIITIFC